MALSAGRFLTQRLTQTTNKYHKKGVQTYGLNTFLFSFIDKHVSVHYDFHIFSKNLKEGIGTFYESYPTHS